MRIAVVTPAYNAAPYIADAICSVLRQTHRDLHCVVVDDGSADDTAAIVARFTDPRVTLVRQPNAGVSAARNRGAELADGDALLFLDADDWLARTALATLAAVLDAAPQAVAAVGAAAVCDDEAQSAAPKTSAPPVMAGLDPAIYPRSFAWDRSHGRCADGRVKPDHDGRDHAVSAILRELLPRLLVQNQFVNPGHVLIRRDAARRAGMFSPGIAYGEDWEYLIRLALQGVFAYVPHRAPVLFVRSRADGAYRRFATDPDAFSPCMNAIFGNAALLERFGPVRLALLRRRAEAENQWIIGRELVRQEKVCDGRRWLRRSVAAAPSGKRIMLLATAHLLPCLPAPLRGPFRPYEPAGRTDRR